jgi:type VI secretion system protein ImpM
MTAEVIVGAAGFYGKIPAEADFVRSRSGSPVAESLASWLEDSLEVGGARADGSAARFVLRFAGEEAVFLGALAQSVDKVGRAFPLAVFAAASGSGLGSAFPLLPRAARAFLDGAEELLRKARSLSLAGFTEGARSLSPPSPGELAGARAWASGPASAWKAGDLLARASGGDPARAPCAWHAFRTACASARGREPLRGAVALDCPVGNEADVYAWLELARRALGWRSAPSFLWREGATRRLVLAFGPPPAAVIGHLLGPGIDHPRIWRVGNAEPGDVASARKALGTRILGTHAQPGLTVGDLVSALSPGGRA